MKVLESAAGVSQKEILLALRTGNVKAQLGSEAEKVFRAFSLYLLASFLGPCTCQKDGYSSLSLHPFVHDLQAREAILCLC